MGTIAADVSIAVNGDARYIGDAHGGADPGYFTVLELHRRLQDLADDAVASGDDLVDITSDTPSDRSTDNIVTLINGFNIDDTLAEHLYDGSVIQTNGDEIYDGIVNFGAAGTHIEVIQDGALITPNFWDTGLNADANQGISHRFLVKTRTAGADIDGRRLLGTARELGNGYQEFRINGSSRGNNVLALSPTTDLNNQTIEATIAGWTTVANLTEGYIGIDVDNDTTNEFYYSEWDNGSQAVNDVYERLKWLTRRGSSSTLYGLNGQLFRGITHEIDIDTATGTFTEPEAVSWSTGTGQLLAIDSTTAGTKMWIQLLTGIAPVDNATITGGTSSATADVNVTITERPISTPFVGASTGSAIIGSYGLGRQVGDLSASDRLFDLTNTQRTPPNNVQFSVAGLVIGEDRVLVGPEAAGVIDVAQLSVATLLSGAAETSIVVVETIPSDTPSPGTIRVTLDSGIERRVAYTSFTGSTFTIASTDFSTDNAAVNNDAYISYIDLLATAVSEDFTIVYAGDRAIYVRARDGGVTPIKTFETPATVGASGGSVTIIRTSDL